MFVTTRGAGPAAGGRPAGLCMSGPDGALPGPTCPGGSRPPARFREAPFSAPAAKEPAGKDERR